MSFRSDFEDGLQKYKKLCLSWTSATALLVFAWFSVPASFTIGLTLWLVGAVNLGATGVRCAYVIARDA